MPIYEYRGLNSTGKNVTGTVEADNLRGAKAKLKRSKIFVNHLKDKKSRKKNSSKAQGSAFGGSVSVQDMSMMTRQLATLLRANIPLVESLGAVSEQVENKTLSECLAEVKGAVNEGSELNRALAKYPKIFNKIYLSMVEAGEKSGTLDIILVRLAEFTEAQSALTSKVRSAMLYPVIMFIFTFLLLIGLFVFVIPKMVTVFEASPELVLPWYTELIIDISNFLIDYWMILMIAGISFFFIFSNWKKTKSGQVQWDAIVLKLPVIGRLVRIIAVSRFSRTLATLLTGGVNMLGAMNIVRNVVNNEILGAAIDNARDNISEGESIAGPLRKSEQFPPILIHMISIGEKTGELENMLIQVSDSYDFQVKNEVDGLTSLLEPLMIIMMGCVIAIIVFAIMIPMFEMSNLGGG